MCKKLWACGGFLFVVPVDFHLPFSLVREKVSWCECILSEAALFLQCHLCFFDTMVVNANACFGAQPCLV